ncbi:MAG: hypothetical protein AAFQ05_02890 [Pseudomonadota bacterium]
MSTPREWAASPDQETARLLAYVLEQIVILNAAQLELTTLAHVASLGKTQEIREKAFQDLQEKQNSIVNKLKEIQEMYSQFLSHGWPKDE